MKKPKSIEARAADAKRGKKRSDRLRTTQAEKGNKKLKLTLKKKRERKLEMEKQQEMISKMLQARADLNK